MPFPIDDYSWEKFGLVYSSAFNPQWGKSHALVPSPQSLTDQIVRIHSSFIDEDFRGRIGFVDIDLSGREPKVVGISESPELDLGAEGTFSQYGVGMGTFWPNEIGEDLYFVGFDRPKEVKFKAFSGKAIYDKTLNKYVHTGNLPFFGPDFGGETIVGVHDIFEHQGLIYALISIGSDFQKISGKDFPKYQVHIASGQDINNLTISSEPIIAAHYPIYRIGRPRIYQINKGFEILVTAGDLAGNYLPRAYYSEDLVNWNEGKCEEFVASTIEGFDDQHQCYLSRFNIGGSEYIVYNGNQMGLAGFGIAKGTPIHG